MSSEIYTMGEAQSNMTLFYSISTGDIKSCCSGIQNMSMFGENELDFSRIWSFKVFPLDEYVLDNYLKFTLNLVTLTIEIKPTIIPNYPTAQI